MSDGNQSKKVVIIGAGVVGLTTALRIQEKGGYSCTIVAELFPTDPKSIKYTSHWAGAHHVSTGEDKLQQKLDKETFEVMWELSGPGKPAAAQGCFLRLPQTEYYHEKFSEPHTLAFMPDYKILPSGSLPPEAICGVSFTTVTIDTPIYLNYLLSRFLASGGSIIRGTVQHISQIAEGGARVLAGGKNHSPPDAIVVCAGIGARSLGGVEDEAVYPIRGQTILVRAPWIRFGRTVSSKDGLWTYIIPRRSGDVIVGGIKVDNDWYPVPRAETTLDILKRGFALCPELAPPEIRVQREATVEDVLPIVIEEGCGLRPGRKGGIRLGADFINVKDKRVPVVFNYGHGGAGFQSSWGSASRALLILEGALAKY